MHPAAAGVSAVASGLPVRDRVVGELHHLREDVGPPLEGEGLEERRPDRGDDREPFGQQFERGLIDLAGRDRLRQGELLPGHNGLRDARHGEDLPSERSLRDILNRMGYRLARVRKATPLKKTATTDAIFANVAAVRAESQPDPAALEISVDTKAKVAEGEYVRGGKNPDGSGRDDGHGIGP